MFQNGFIAGHKVVWKPRQSVIGFIFTAAVRSGRVECHALLQPLIHLFAEIYIVFVTFLKGVVHWILS